MDGPSSVKSGNQPIWKALQKCIAGSHHPKQSSRIWKHNQVKWRPYLQEFCHKGWLRNSGLVGMGQLHC